MKRKNILLLSIACVVLAIIGLGLSVIYSVYFYRVETLTTIFLSDPNLPWMPGMPELTEEESNQKMFSFMQSVDEWARTHKATIIYKEPFSAGRGYCDYSGWLTSSFDDYSNESGVEKNGGVYITKSDLFKEAYVKDGILLPRTLKLKVSGTYRGEKLGQLANSDFFYPLLLSTAATGTYLTDAEDTDSLVHLFEENGYEVSYINNPLPLPKMIQRIMEDDRPTRAVLFGIAGLFIFFIYNILLLCRENLRSLQIRHIFGLSKKRMLFTSIGIALLVSAISIGLFMSSLFYVYFYMSAYDFRRLILFVSIGTVVVSIVTSIICAISVNHSVTKVR